MAYPVLGMLFSFHEQGWHHDNSSLADIFLPGIFLHSSDNYISISKKHSSKKGWQTDGKKEIKGI